MKKKLLALLAAAVLSVGICLPVAADTPPTGIRLNRSSIKLGVDETRQLTATVLPAGTGDTGVEWRSSDERIATVSDGTVTGVSEGTATVTATTSNGHSTPCTVVVRGNEVLVKSMEMSLSSMTVRAGQHRQLWIRFTPTDTTERDVAWSSSDQDIATVDTLGVVTGVAPGTATITATAFSGATTTCKVTVPGKTAGTQDGDAKTTAAPSGGETLTAAEVRTAIRKLPLTTLRGETAVAGFKGKATVPADALQAAAEAAAKTERNVYLRFSTLKDNGKAQGSLTFRAQSAGDRTADLKTGVRLDSEEAAAVAKRLEKSFQSKVAVIHCAEERYGFSAQIAAKADLTGMDASNLSFYRYDPAAKTHSPLEVAKVRVDDSGYLRFSTSTGGLIVVSDGPLVKK